MTGMQRATVSQSDPSSLPWFGQRDNWNPVHLSPGGRDCITGLAASSPTLAESTTISHGPQGLQVQKLALLDKLSPTAGVPHSLVTPPTDVPTLQKGGKARERVHPLGHRLTWHVWNCLALYTLHRLIRD